MVRVSSSCRPWFVIGVAAFVMATLGADGGCGTYEEDPPVPGKPTKRGLALIRSSADPPVYWLGVVYDGEELSIARSGRPGTSFTYGERSCDPGSGCSYGTYVDTQRKRDVITDPPVCWRRWRGAWLLGCAGGEEAEILTGQVMVRIGSADAIYTARSLTRLDRATSARKLAAPRRFSCREAKRFSRTFRARLPKTLRPRCS